MLSRRSFLTALFAAPAIVHYSNIMPVKFIMLPTRSLVLPIQLALITRRAFLPSLIRQLDISMPMREFYLDHVECGFSTLSKDWYVGDVQ